MKNKTLVGLFLATLMAISITGLTYALWSETLEIKGTIKMASFGIKIISYKALLSKCVEKYSEMEATPSPDGQFLYIEATNLKPCWYTWIGLKIQNDGDLPANIKHMEYLFEPYNFDDYFTVKEYFYGPFPEAEGQNNPIHEVWDDAKIGEELDEDGGVDFSIPYVSTPFATDPGEKVIVWIWIHCDENVPPELQGQTATLIIKIVDDLAI